MCLMDIYMYTKKLRTRYSKRFDCPQISWGSPWNPVGSKESEPTIKFWRQT